MLLGAKSIYEKKSFVDGTRVLVERHWPRGVKKVSAPVDLWVKEAAPSDELRKWFAHDLKKWKEFKKRYLKELKENRKQALAIKKLARIAMDEDVTLIYASHDENHNIGKILCEVVEEEIRKMGKPKAPSS
ncbi:MAG: DUF488 family protein [Candidatus Micrarchaeaceae archaeon]